MLKQGLLHTLEQRSASGRAKCLAGGTAEVNAGTANAVECMQSATLQSQQTPHVQSEKCLQNGGTAADAKKREHDEAGLANNPFPSTPPGMMGSGYAMNALVADPNRAFQTINADTLEQASKTTEIHEPSQAVSIHNSRILSVPLAILSLCQPCLVLCQHACRHRCGVGSGMRPYCACGMGDVDLWLTRQRSLFPNERGNAAACKSSGPPLMSVFRYTPR